MSTIAVRERVTHATIGPDTIDRLDWSRLEADLCQRGFANTGPLLEPETCRAIAGYYDDDRRWRSHVRMARHGFGQGEYKYFNYPLPDIVATLRATLYPRLVPIANRWHEQTGRDERFPALHDQFLRRCHDAGQTLPTPLLLRYRTGDYNCLHQDIYGPLVFPLQVAILLDDPSVDFSGGEFVLTEQRPRMQSRAEVIQLGMGEAVIFAVNERPVEGKRGVYRVRMRHGVSQVHSGERHVLGVIFHDAA